MADRTITINENKTVTMDSSYLGIQGEQVSVDFSVATSLSEMGLDAYVDFRLPSGNSVFKGAYDCSSGAFNFGIGATDNILDEGGEVYLQLVLAETEGDVRTAIWKSLMFKTNVAPSINATSSAVLPYVPQMVFPGNYPAELIELADSGNKIVAVNVEDAIQELADKIQAIEEAILLL